MRGIVLIKNLFMLSDMNCCSSLVRMFQYYQNTLMKSLSERSLSVEWLGLMLMISDKGFIKSCKTKFLYFPIFFVKPSRVFRIRFLSVSCYSSLFSSSNWWSNWMLRLFNEKSLDEDEVFCNGKSTLKL